MDTEEVKPKYFDVAPPVPRKKPTELNMQNRQIMVNDPYETSEQDADPNSEENNVPVQVRRELKIGPIDQPDEPATELKPVETPEDAFERQVLAKAAAKDEIVGHPVISNRKIVTDADDKKEDVAVELPKEQPQETPVQSIPPAEPIPETAPQNVEIIEEPAKIDAPAVEPVPETEPAQEKPIETPVNVSETIEDKDTPASETFASVDGLPDANVIAANKIKDDMQEPKIYDTTAYHVPIKETVHGHGGLTGAFIFGTIFAIAVVCGIVYVLYLISS